MLNDKKRPADISDSAERWFIWLVELKVSHLDSDRQIRESHTYV